MKKPNYTVLALALAIFSLIYISPTNAQNANNVVWFGDPDKAINDVFRRFDTDVNGNQSNCSPIGTKPTATAVNDGSNGKVWRIRKYRNRKRAEFARTGGNGGFVHQEGQTYYHAFRVKFSSNDNINKGMAVWQWKTDSKGGTYNNTQNYPLAMGWDGSYLALSAYGPYYPNWNNASGSINKRRTRIWRKAVGKDQWVSIVMKIKADRDPSKGYIELWFDGVKQTLGNAEDQDYRVTLSSDKKRAYHKTFDGGEVYQKWGIYNQSACDFDITSYLDEMRSATTYADVDPDAWNGGGSSGGGSGGGNTDDIVSVSVPNSVQRGSNVSVNVNYSSSTDRDIQVIFQLDQSPWTAYASEKKDVSAGSGSLTFNLNIPSSTPLGNDKYQFQTYITTNNGGWNQRLDNINRPNVDVTNGGGSSGGSSDITNGVYRFQNVNTGQYLDADGSNIIRIKNSNGNPDQEWGLHATADGYYNIDSRFSGRGLLDSDPNGIVKWSTTSPTNNGDGFEWKPIKLSNGNYRFENRIAGRKYLRYNGNSSVVGYSDAADSRSEWKLTRVSNLRTGSTDDGSLASTSISIYPNPTSSIFTIDLSGFDKAVVSINNMQGQNVGSYNVSGNQLSLSAEHLVAGIYTVSVTDAAGNKAFEKLIVK